MSRPESAHRVDPVPVPYVVPADIAGRSPLRGRLVGSTAHHPAVGSELLVDDRVAPLLEALSRPWERFAVTADVGLAGMVGGREFFAAIRGLTDELLLPLAIGRRGIAIDPASAPEVFHGLFPDAVDRPDRLPGQPVAPAGGTEAQPAGDRLVLVVGAGRSGTTWLEQLLLAHPRIGGVPHWESWIFEQLQPLWNLADQWPDGAVDRAVRRYADAIFDATLARHSPGADHVIEKTPMHSYRLGRISAAYPDAWVVHLVRDGRDVARSMSRVPFFGVPDVADAARVWALVERAIREARPGLSRYREVRYEALFADPVGTVTDLCEWIGLDVDGTVADAIGRAAAERVSTHAGTADGVGPGGWRTLPADDADRIYAVAGPVLRETGYAGPIDVFGRRWRARMRRLLSSRSASST